MVSGFGGKARFVAENYGDSALAKKFGVTRYPAIFVGDVLAATPKDFGFYGTGEGADGGRYAPLKSAEAHERFRSDLTRMIELVLAGDTAAARAQAPGPGRPDISSLPAAFSITDLDGRKLSRQDLAGRPVLVEFWATWCPPCRGTLGWLGEVKKRYGDKVAVVAIAVESDEPKVRQLAAELRLPFVWSMGTPDIARSFGDLGGVPTLFLFDGAGQTKGVFFGAPPDLHARAEASVAALLK
ncbi:MAG: TlpA disulfide reductase family protein [Acidobacteriota bacterium]